MNRRQFFSVVVTASAAARAYQNVAMASEPELAANGLRRLSGASLELITDLPEAPEIEQLPHVFDLAVPQWCRYFEVPQQQVSGWKMSACLMRESERFRRAGLLPPDLPKFLNGYQRGNRCWLYEQPSDYYRRVLLLHEGTHAFMREWLGGAGPPWYMEGLAEYLGTHSWQDGRLALAHLPGDRQQASHWGRIKILRDQFAAGQLLSLVEIMKYGSQAHLRVEPYAWCWAAVVFLDQHPQYRDAFRACRREVRDSSLDFSRRLYERLESRWREVEASWYAFLAEVDYGYEPASALLTWPEQAVGPAEPAAMIRVDARLGWQATHLRLEAGRTYKLEATGRYEIHQQPRTWWCEPQGVTLRYHAGHPLGALLATVFPDDSPPATMARSVSEPRLVGRAAELKPQQSGRLLLRINDSPAELSENRGAAEVRIAATTA